VLAFGLWNAVQRVQFTLSGSAVVDAVVGHVDLKPSTSGSRTRDARISFVTNDGHKFGGQIRVGPGGDVDAASIGSSLPVRYSLDDPSDFHVDAFGPMWVVPLSLVIFPLAGVLGLGIAFRRARRLPR